MNKLENRKLLMCYLLNLIRYFKKERLTEHNKKDKKEMNSKKNWSVC